MSKSSIKNLEASIRARLLNYSKTREENYNAVLLRFFQERFLARLGVSNYREYFVLKGGLLLLTQHVSRFRPTVDIDFLGRNIENDSENLKTAIKEIAGIRLDDGVSFNAEEISARVINEDAEYEGLRFSFGVSLGKIQSRMQVDIGFGDKIVGSFVNQSIPSMLPDFRIPAILSYPLTSVIAEKFQAIIYLGYANSRMKDFYDILFLAKHNTFSSKELGAAIHKTFEVRNSDLGNRLFLYERNFIVEKSLQWRTFLKKTKSDLSDDFFEAIQRIKMFLEPVIMSNDFNKNWNNERWIWE